MWLNFGLLCIIVFCVALLAITIKSQNEIVSNLLAIQTEKLLKNNFAQAKLAVVYGYGMGNLPPGFN